MRNAAESCAVGHRNCVAVACWNVAVVPRQNSPVEQHVLTYKLCVTPVNLRQRSSHVALRMPYRLSVTMLNAYKDNLKPPVHNVLLRSLASKA